MFGKKTVEKRGCACGFALEPNFKFCPGCGKKIAAGPMVKPLAKKKRFALFRRGPTPAAAPPVTHAALVAKKPAPAKPVPKKISRRERYRRRREHELEKEAEYAPPTEEVGVEEFRKEFEKEEAEKGLEELGLEPLEELDLSKLEALEKEAGVVCARCGSEGGEELYCSSCGKRSCTKCATAQVKGKKKNYICPFCEKVV